jgi:hypothetical protein
LSAGKRQWAIAYPQQFNYPVEGVSIDKAYLHFTDWAGSGLTPIGTATQQRDIEILLIFIQNKLAPSRKNEKLPKPGSFSFFIEFNILF